MDRQFGQPHGGPTEVQHYIFKSNAGPKTVSPMPVLQFPTKLELKEIAVNNRAGHFRQLIRLGSRGGAPLQVEGEWVTQSTALILASTLRAPRVL